MKKNQLYRKFFKLRKHAEKGQYILNDKLGFVYIVFDYLTHLCVTNTSNFYSFCCHADTQF